MTKLRCVGLLYVVSIGSLEVNTFDNSEFVGIHCISKY